MPKFTKAVGFEPVPRDTDRTRYRTVFNFRIAQHEGPAEINNLWDLMTIDKNGTVLELIVDADSLGACVDNLSALMEEEGF